MTAARPAYQPRIDRIDALRGFALMGLFLVHCSEYFELYWLKPPAHDLWHDWIFGLFANKSFAMFALMFGVSFFIIMDRAQQRGVDFRARFLWRLVVLFIIGFFHTLFYGGDVLQVLALVGLLLVPVNSLSNGWLVALAAVCALQPNLVYTLWHTLHDVSANVAPHHWSYPALQVYAHGDLAQVFKANLWPANKWWFYIETGRVFEILGLFCIGLMLGRTGFLSEPERHNLARRIAFAIAAVIAIGLHVFKPELPKLIAADPVHFVAAWARDGLFDNFQSLAAMTLYVCGFIELYQTKIFQPFLRLLAPMGRMTLTLYVMQAVICVPIFYACGLGLYSSIGQPRAFLLAISLFLAQMAFAHLWFRAFYYGPLEWLWRAGTYLTLKVPFVRRRPA